jgi:hypothetical protein
VLVGHSVAGLIIPLVATRRPVRRLVFLHALLPRPGQSAVDQMTAEPGMFNQEMFTATAPFWEDEAVAVRFLLHDCPPEVVRDCFRRLRPEPGVLGWEVTPLASWPEVPSSYIVCADDRTATPAWARRAARERLGVEPVEPVAYLTKLNTFCRQNRLDLESAWYERALAALAGGNE